MKFWDEFKSMSPWAKIAAVSAVITIIGFGISFIPSKSSPSQQQSINGNGNTQIGSVTGNISLNQETQKQRDPQSSAQAIRVATESFREIARMHMRDPVPQDWVKAEELYKLGRDNYSKHNYDSAFENFDSAGRIYQDLYSQAMNEGH